MKNKFLISQAAQMTNMTSETLRYYDRIGLVCPSQKDPDSGYRYYSQQEIVRLNTIQALRCMDLSLKEIKEILAYDDLQKIVGFLEQAEQRADDKIAKLQYAKTKIQKARNDYLKKLQMRQLNDNIFIEQFDERVIMLADKLQYPTVDNLWQYHRHFYQQLEAKQQKEFVFADLAGVFIRDGQSRLFAVCLRYPDKAGLTVLPAGKYLCADCSEQNKDEVQERLVQLATEKYGARVDFIVQIVVVSGILQWNYQLQLLLEQQ